jgi:hypothetical protein
LKYGAKGIDSVLKSVFGDSSNKRSNAGVLTLKSLAVGASFKFARFVFLTKRGQMPS